MNKKLTFGLTSVLFLLLFIIQSCKKAQSTKAPNILLIYADDLGYGDVRVYHPASKIPTPNIDALANNGLLFTDAHAAAGVCTPSRYALLTGKYPFRSRLPKGVLWVYDLPLIERDQPTLASFLKAQGYHTGLIGKWHLGFDWPTREGVTPEDWGKLNDLEKEALIDFSKPLEGGPNSIGFDYFFGMDTPNFPPYAFLENGYIVGELPERLDTFMITSAVPGVQQKDWANEKILPKIKEKAIEYLEEKADDEQAFFLFLSLTAPHTPITPSQEFKGRSEAGDYGDLVVQVDDIVGKLVEKVEALGIKENTIVIFTSDNGSPGQFTEGSYFGTIFKEYGHFPNGKLRGLKGDSWEAGNRIPFIVSWPGQVPQGATSDAIICQTDLLATVAELLQKPMPSQSGIDSYSLLSVFMQAGEKTSERRTLVTQSSLGHLSIRKDGWKLIKGKGSGGITARIDPNDGKGSLPGQLYHISQDPSEKNDLYGDPKYANKIKELEALLEEIKAKGNY